MTLVGIMLNPGSNCWDLNVLKWQNNTTRLDLGNTSVAITWLILMPFFCISPKPFADKADAPNGSKKVIGRSESVINQSAHSLQSSR
jgi:hypothetical protein